MPSTPVLALALPLLLPSLAAQEVLLDLDLGDTFEPRVDAMGDVDGDGRDDLLVGLRSLFTGGSGEVRLLSGLDGQPLWSVTGLPGEGFAESVASLADLDGDGVRDLAVGAWVHGGPGGPGSGRVVVLSGASGAPLLTFFGSAPGDNLGVAVAEAGDVDGDGWTDVVVGAYRSDGAAGFDVGRVLVFSGADGSLLLEREGETQGEQLGLEVAGAGDVDGDGRADVIAASRADAIVRVYSGATGLVLHQVNGSTQDGFGDSVGSAGDRDGDGRDDFWITSTVAGGNGEVRVHSGASGNTLELYAGVQGTGILGPAVEWVGDLDGDGQPEVWIGSGGVDSNALANAGTVALYRAGGAGILWRIDGAEPQEFLGDEVSGAGDVDGDGSPDLAYTHARGRVVVVSTRLEDPPSRPSVARTWSGLFTGDRFGESVGSAGDLDGDGVPDVVVGSPGADHVPPSGGLAQVFSGATGTELLTLSAIPGGDAPPVEFGAAVAGGARFDGDGVPDLVVGEPGYKLQGPERGAVHLMSGSSGTTVTFLVGDGNSDRFGSAVAVVPDVDANGRDEVLVGAPGQAYLLSRPGYARLYGALGAVRYTWNGDLDGDRFGAAVAHAGDVDADGIADVVVGGPGFDGAGVDRGVARVFSGASGALLHEFVGEFDGEALGSAVDGAGDLDGDGHGDLVVGAPGYTGSGRGSGRVLVYSGAGGSLLFEFQGEDALDALGTSVVGVGDVDGDGVADLAVGAPEAEQAAGEAGSVLVLSGRTGELLLREFGDSFRDNLGASLAAVGDLDGDGLAEVLVGVPRDDLGAPNAGGAWLLTRPAFLAFCPGLANSTGEAARLSATGSPVVADGDLTLRVERAPASTFGVFFFGPGRTELPFGNGLLCLAGGLTRFQPPLLTDGSGHLAFAPDLGAPPAAGVLLPGTRFGFQFWYRDPLGVPTSFNLSGALDIAFE